MTPNGRKKFEKQKGKDVTYELAALPDVLIMSPNRKLTVTNGSTFFKFKFNDGKAPGDPPELIERSEPIGGVETLTIKMKNLNEIDGFVYDIVENGNPEDPIIIIDPQ